MNKFFSTQQIAKPFEKSFIQKALVLIYIVSMLIISANAKADIRITPIMKNQEQLQIKTFSGEIVLSGDGELFLVTADEQAYKLKSKSDLSDYNGKTVQIAAHEIQYHAGPALKLAAFNPDQDPQDQVGDEQIPVLYVFGINELNIN